MNDYFDNWTIQLRKGLLEIGILKRMIQELPGKTNRIEILTTASMIPEETGQHYIDAFHRLGNTNIDVIHIREKEDVNNPEYIQRIQRAEGVLMTGGDQSRLTSIFTNSEILVSGIEISCGIIKSSFLSASGIDSL